MAPRVRAALGRDRRMSVVVARAIVPCSLALAITTVFLAVVVGGGALMGTNVPNTALMLVATALVAVGFEPVRARLDSWVDGVVLGRGFSSWEAVSRLSAEMGHQEDPDRVLETLAAVTQDATGAGLVVVWLCVDRRMVPVASWPEDASFEPVTVKTAGLSALEGVDVVVPIGCTSTDGHAEPTGAVTLTLAGAEPLRPVEQRLLADLAAAASSVVQTVHLRRSLHQRLELAGQQQHEFVAERRRTASAQLAERRRLERDIHDSGQQGAVVLVAKLGLVRSLIATDPDQAAAVLCEVEEDIDRLSVTLVELAEGRELPARFGDGIGAALHTATADLGVTVDVVDEAGDSYPQPIREAVYSCCTEAVQNALKHAGASTIEVRLHEEAGQLHVNIRDDGVGFDTTTASSGAGLANMRERLAALDGALVLRSGPRGTEVRGRVPIPRIGTRA